MPSLHQTTIRFSVDTWARIEREARARGVSAAQFVRESTIARLASESPLASESVVHLAPAQEVAHEIHEAKSALSARTEATYVLEDSEAVWAQARLARNRAREVREQARSIQARRPVAPR
jgi:ribonuclease D